MAKKKSDKGSPKVNPKLKGFDIKIDRFGEIKSTLDIDKINEFLNEEVDDKKLRDRDGLETESEEEEENDKNKE